MADNFEDVFYLTDDDGNKEAFEFLDLVEYEGCEYAVLYPLDEAKDNGELVILQVEDLNEEEDAYIEVEDQEVLEGVFELFKANHADEYDFD